MSLSRARTASNGARQVASASLGSLRHGRDGRTDALPGPTQLRHRASARTITRSPPAPSSRLPGTIRTHAPSKNPPCSFLRMFSTHDYPIGLHPDFGGIERSLTEGGLAPTTPWGLAVYRTAYHDDDAWQRMLDDLQADLSRSFTNGDRPGLLRRHHMAVFDDRAALDGARVHDVRARFAQWAAEEVRRHWPDDKPLPGEEGHSAALDRLLFQGGARYNFCLLVDEAGLESPEKVKIVKRDWEEGAFDEGIEEDVGWMYKDHNDYVYICQVLHDIYCWQDGFYEHPRIAQRDPACTSGR